MAAHALTAGKLYLATCQLAYSLTQLARGPLPPFAIANQAQLWSLAGAAASAAQSMRPKDPKILSQTKVDTAAQLLAQAQIMLDTIATALPYTLTTAAVTSAVNSGIAAVNTL